MFHYFRNTAQTFPNVGDQPAPTTPDQQQTLIDNLQTWKTNHYKELLISITKNPEAKIGELSMLSAKETEELSRGFQFCEASFPVGKVDFLDMFLCSGQPH